MYRNDVIEKRLDNLIWDQSLNKFKRVKTNSLSEIERQYLYKKAAIGMAHLVYRNGKIEDYHAGSCTEANIPDSVMKSVNKDVCNKCYNLIVAFGGSDVYISKMIMRCYIESKLYGHNWDEPVIN